MAKVAEIRPTISGGEISSGRDILSVGLVFNDRIDQIILPYGVRPVLLSMYAGV